ncbi:hypothetical protein HPB48_015604 [Haemaphysalis longicornis]|uniref:Uncharacterized protein n=1 Tax=Haemaphysalis longicornis TaxID=44386 RepID=A0A9J6FHF1_HAELO|nr:hypothetical protein HPB48_015604 [Haemaphysalis longicornis]
MSDRARAGHWMSAERGAKAHECDTPGGWPRAIKPHRVALRDVNFLTGRWANIEAHRAVYVPRGLRTAWKAAAFQTWCLAAGAANVPSAVGLRRPECARSAVGSRSRLAPSAEYDGIPEDRLLLRPAFVCFAPRRSPPRASTVPPAVTVCLGRFWCCLLSVFAPALKSHCCESLSEPPARKIVPVCSGTTVARQLSCVYVVLHACARLLLLVTLLLPWRVAPSYGLEHPASNGTENGERAEPAALPPVWTASEWRRQLKGCDVDVTWNGTARISDSSRFRLLHPFLSLAEGLVPNVTYTQVRQLGPVTDYAEHVPSGLTRRRHAFACWPREQRIKRRPGRSLTLHYRAINREPNGTLLIHSSASCFLRNTEQFVRRQLFL